MAADAPGPTPKNEEPQGAAKAAGWQDHRVHQGDGKGAWVERSALRQVIKYPDANYTINPFGLVRMDNGEIAILCSRERNPSYQPIIAFSKDDGAAVIPRNPGHL